MCALNEGQNQKRERATNLLVIGRRPSKGGDIYFGDDQK